jgi:hypothetical protein
MYFVGCGIADFFVRTRFLLVGTHWRKWIHDGRRKLAFFLSGLAFENSLADVSLDYEI